MEGKKLIEVRNLSKHFHKKQVLKDISLDINKGDVVCLIGPSGSGKSTFLRCLNRLEEASSGEILFEGTDICKKDVNIDLHRQKMGMVFQQFNLFPHMTIFRSGINSVPKGQMEAGRSLGFSYPQTMITIIMPQVIKNILPTLANEFIVLMKETSVASYIALDDLTKAGDVIRSKTYSAMMPFLAVALLYLIMVMLFSYLVKLLERRLARSGR